VKGSQRPRWACRWWLHRLCSEGGGVGIGEVLTRVGSGRRSRGKWSCRCCCHYSRAGGGDSTWRTVLHGGERRGRCSGFWSHRRNVSAGGSEPSAHHLLFCRVLGMSGVCVPPQRKGKEREEGNEKVASRLTMEGPGQEDSEGGRAKRALRNQDGRKKKRCAKRRMNTPLCW
jgi:hypothetical protein